MSCVESVLGRFIGLAVWLARAMPESDKLTAVFSAAFEHCLLALLHVIWLAAGIKKPR